MTEAVPKLNGVHADSDDEVRITKLIPVEAKERPIPSLTLETKVGDPDPQEPHFFGPPVSGSISQRH